LTTRIECSRAHCGDRRQSLRTSATPQIIAGKRADTIWGKTIFPLHPWRGAGTHFSGIPEGMPVKSRSIHEPSPQIAPRNRAPEPWENASRRPLETVLLRHSFKMPITTTKLSTNENEPAWLSPCRPVRGNRFPKKWDRPQLREKLAEAVAAVKRPEKYASAVLFFPLPRYSRPPPGGLRPTDARRREMPPVAVMARFSRPWGESARCRPAS